MSTGAYPLRSPILVRPTGSRPATTIPRCGMGKQRTQRRARTASAPRLRKREVLRLAERLRTDDLSFKGYSILPNSCWIQGPPEVVARGEAATALGEFGAEASPAIPAL